MNAQLEIPCRGPEPPVPPSSKPAEQSNKEALDAMALGEPEATRSGLTNGGTALILSDGLLCSNKMSLSRLSWYWHRLRAMSPDEMRRHFRKRLDQRADARRLPAWGRGPLARSGRFPNLPGPAAAPAGLEDRLRG